jgi:hypothetical protein
VLVIYALHNAAKAVSMGHKKRSEIPHLRKELLKECLLNLLIALSLSNEAKVIEMPNKSKRDIDESGI